MSESSNVRKRGSELKRNQEKKQEKEEKKKNGGIITLILFIILLIIIILFFLWLKWAPKIMFEQGKKYLNAGQYARALQCFTRVASVDPYDAEPVYYQAITLSKMPPTYETQKQLYEISQLEDCDVASNLAEKVLEEMHKQFAQQVGPNYVDNILSDEGVLVRWNNSRPITYSINANGTIPDGYVSMVKDALNKWQIATNGEITFKETPGNRNANICINFVDDVSPDKSHPKSLAGRTVPVMDVNTLKRMDVFLKRSDMMGRPLPADDKLANVTLHEIGHALGIGGHSFDDNDVMGYSGDYLTADTWKREITERDLNTIHLLYRMYPDVIDVPLTPEESMNLYYHPVLTAYPDENFEQEIKRLIGEINNNKEDIVSWVDLAINYAYKKNYLRSNTILENVLPLVSTDLQNQFVVLYNMSANYYKMRNYNLSEKFLRLAESLDQDIDTQTIDVYLDVRFKKYDIAKRKLTEYIRQNPENVDFALKLAEVYYLERDNKKASQVIDELIKRYPASLRDRRVQKYKVKKEDAIFVGKEVYNSTTGN